MRLPPEQANIIRQTAQSQFGPGTRVWLFGSRTNDHARGGDIDLLIETRQPLENAFRESVALETALQVKLGDQKIDILLLYPGAQITPIHQIAHATGIEL